MRSSTELRTQTPAPGPATNVNNARIKPINQQDRLKEACQGFESIFLHTLLREGRGNSSVSISSGEGNAMGMVQDIRDEAVGKEMARAGGVGLAQMLYRTLSDKAQVSPAIADKISERRNSP